MIRCELIPLGIERQQSLRAYLKQPMFDLLVAVGEAKAKEYECNALADALESNSTNAKEAGFKANLVHAQRYRDFVEVLKEFQAADVHHTAKLT